MENHVLEAILSRSSIRAYKEKSLDSEQIEALKKAALASPTAMNRQEQRFVFITDSKTIEKLNTAVFDAVIASGNEAFAERIRSRGGRILYSPPLLVCIFSKQSNYAGVDAGIAVENLALAAKSIGLDSVILGMPAIAFTGEEGAKLTASLGVPEGYEFRIGISIGYKDTEKEPHEWDKSHIIEIK